MLENWCFQCLKTCVFSAWKRVFQWLKIGVFSAWKWVFSLPENWCFRCLKIVFCRFQCLKMPFSGSESVFCRFECLKMVVFKVWKWVFSRSENGFVRGVSQYYLGWIFPLSGLDNSIIWASFCQNLGWIIWMATAYTLGCIRSIHLDV